MPAPRPFPYDEGYPPYWRGWPQHMVPAERELFFWYLDRPSTNVNEIWFDVAMDGTPAADSNYPAAAEILDPKWLRVFYGLNARRADAVIHKPDGFAIVELRDHADAQTIGETVIYAAYARDEWQDLDWTHPVIITRAIDDGVARAARAQGITVCVAPADLYDPANVETRYVPTAILKPR
jgi:hypothetical protein